MARYHHNGTALPSVTEVIRGVGLGPDYGAVPSLILAAAARRGVEVHRAVQAIDDGGDPPERTAPTRGYIAAYERFRLDCQYRPIVCETPLISTLDGYGGTPDKVGWVGMRRLLLDVKTPQTVHLPSTTMQLAAYERLWGQARPDEPLQGVAALQLRSNGTYRLHPLETARALRVFLCALRVYRGEATDAQVHELRLWQAEYGLPRPCVPVRGQVRQRCHDG